MDLDDGFTALADGTRRTILKRLASGEARVTEVAEPFDISLNSVSKHIRILERAGLVRRRVAGRDHFLSLERKPFDDLTAWMQQTREAWTQRLDALEAALRAGTGLIETIAPVPQWSASSGSAQPSAMRRVGIRMDDGTMQFIDTDAPSLRVGDRVQITPDGYLRNPAQ